jgi:hypothetical protein
MYEFLPAVLPFNCKERFRIDFLVGVCLAGC